MSADAMARLRRTLKTALDEARAAGHSTKDISVRLVDADDLRALLDRAALLDEALPRLSDVQGYVRCGDRAALGVDYERGIAEGERRERARVVADLRTLAVAADDVKGDLMQRSREWLQSCVNAATRSGEPEEADLEAFLLAHLDGEPARQAAAVDAELALVVGHLREAASLFDDPRGDVLTNYADAFEGKEHRHE